MQQNLSTMSRPPTATRRVSLEPSLSRAQSLASSSSTSSIVSPAMKRTSLDSVASPPTTSRRQSMAPTAASTAPGNVRVVCRFRPQNAIEQANNGNMCITFPSAKSVQIKDVDNNTPFTFDQIFQSDSEQQDIYEDVGRPVVADVLEGYNATIFAYGQTGGGKTFTMEGPNFQDPAARGLIPRMVEGIFDGMRNAEEHIEFTVRVSVVEIYMEKIRDLLNPAQSNLSVREDRELGIRIDGASEFYVASESEVFGILQTGQQNRAVAATKMNAGSSRSHSIVNFMITQKNTLTDSSRVGKLYLVDLAGSEKVGKTGAEGSVLEEAKTINKSLSALGNVINALTDGKSTHVPYRDSKLTRVLQESLGGNARTALVICCSPSSFNAQETLSTLRFGARAKNIRNQAHINQEKSVQEYKMLLAQAEQQNERLQTKVDWLERKLKEAGIEATFADFGADPSLSLETNIAEETIDSESDSDSEHDSPPLQSSAATADTTISVSLLDDDDKSSVNEERTTEENFTVEHHELLEAQQAVAAAAQRESEQGQVIVALQARIESLEMNVLKTQAEAEEAEAQCTDLRNQLADLQADSTVERFQMLEQLQQLRDQLSEQSALAASAATVAEVVAVESNLPTNQIADKSSSAEPAVAAPQIDSEPVASESVSAVQQTEQETSIAAASTQDDESTEVVDAPDQLPASNTDAQVLYTSTLTQLRQVAAKHARIVSMLHAERHQISHALTQKEHELQDMKQNFLADLQNRVTKVVALQALLAESNEKYEALVRQHSGEEQLKLKISSLEAHIHQAQAVHQKISAEHGSLKHEKDALEKKLSRKEMRLENNSLLLMNAQLNAERSAALLTKQDAELGILRAILGSRPLSPGGVGTVGAASPAAAGTPGANFSTVRPLPKKVIKGQSSSTLVAPNGTALQNGASPFVKKFIRPRAASIQDDHAEAPYPYASDSSTSLSAASKPVSVAKPVNAASAAMGADGKPADGQCIVS